MASGLSEAVLCRKKNHLTTEPPAVCCVEKEGNRPGVFGRSSEHNIRFRLDHLGVLYNDI
jgi:hypothetical protein